MSRLPLPNKIMFLALLVLAAAQLFLSFSFWAGTGGENRAYAYAMIAVGCSLAVIEMVILLVATNGAVRRFAFIAAFARAVFVPLWVLNTGCDVLAIGTHMANDVRARQSDAVRYEILQDQQQETKDRIATLHADLAGKGLDRPAGALEFMANQMEASVDDRTVSEETRQWRSRRAAELSAAREIAREAEQLEAALSQLRRQQSDAGAAPGEQPDHLVMLVSILSWMGIYADPEMARQGITVGLALVLRITLATGFWFVLGPFVRADNEVPMARSAPANGFPRQEATRHWRWPGMQTSPPAPRTNAHEPLTREPPPRERARPESPPPPPASEPTTKAGRGGAPAPRSRGAGRRNPGQRDKDLFNGKDPLDDLDPA